MLTSRLLNRRDLFLAEHQSSGTNTIDFRFTGQRLDESVGVPTNELARGLYFYNVR